jgi:hypothetical protein
MYPFYPGYIPNYTMDPDDRAAICILRYFKNKMASMRLPSLMTFFLIRYFINYRIPGKFAMCENLLRHRLTEFCMEYICFTYLAGP